ncbi:hypothetical protein MTAT_20200 [Moorella thermoacetica]|uniref:Uncharacterized protein n=1 Tax=Neomoorella thermoacetica TaxID=1525 RepID=A0AAC9MVB6_NEOTH|nr:hypothetical protein [Moorella thermoacetica]AOQ24675.1 hypothetical protein Maut_02247 [Moorella thermoacetica]TYL12778.1 hypothetical protein MTAT_20200 [Moorella thermoacetica]
MQKSLSTFALHQAFGPVHIVEELGDNRFLIERENGRQSEIDLSELVPVENIKPESDELWYVLPDQSTEENGWQLMHRVTDEFVRVVRGLSRLGSDFKLLAITEESNKPVVVLASRLVRVGDWVAYLETRTPLIKKEEPAPGPRDKVTHQGTWLSCLNCRNYIKWDWALAQVGPQTTDVMGRYSSMKGCAAYPAPDTTMGADMYRTERCVTNSLAKLFDENVLVPKRGAKGWVWDNRAGRSVPLAQLEYQAMAERAEWCPYFTPWRGTKMDQPWRQAKRLKNRELAIARKQEVNEMISIVIKREIKNRQLVITRVIRYGKKELARQEMELGAVTMAYANLRGLLAALRAVEALAEKNPWAKFKLMGVDKTALAMVKGERKTPVALRELAEEVVPLYKRLKEKLVA